MAKRRFATARVVIADDHALIREGVRAALAHSQDITVVGEAATGGDAQRLCRQLQPDILLLDLSMPGPPARETLVSLRTSCPKTRVIILTAFADAPYVGAAIELGARGYVLKDDTVTAAAEAIHTVTAGGTWFSHALVPSLAQQPVRPSGQPRLTGREQEVLGLLSTGLTNGEIAKALGITTRSVESHVRNLFDKLGAHSRTEAVHRARQRALLPSEIPPDA